MAAQPVPEKKGKFRIEDIPESVRKMIMVILIAVLMLAVFFIWLPNFLSSLVIPFAQESAGLKGVGQDLNDLLKNINFNFPTTSAATPENNEVDLAELKKKLGDKLTGDWLTYRDFDHNFTIKYPSGLFSTTTAEALISFRQSEAAPEMLAIKKFDNYNNFANRLDLKKYWERGNYFIAVFDYSQNTTTELMFNSFNFIENNL